MVYVFLIFGLLTVYFSLLSFIGGVSFLRFVRLSAADGGRPSGERRFVTIFAPCRGLEPHLAENLSALLRQDYPRYEVIFAVDDPSDPAADVIGRLLNESGKAAGCSARLVVVRPENRSGRKVEVLCGAVGKADPEAEIFVFFDSDACPHPGWLAALTQPLGDDANGAVTGYRWFLPPTFSFSGQLRAAWNASIASALGGDTRKNFCWGGATAIRRDTFERLSIRDKWTGTASDDFILTREVRRAGLGIVFQPLSIVASKGDCTPAEVLEFTTRQMKITRTYSPRLWLASLLGSGLFVFVTAAGIALPAAGFAAGDRFSVVVPAVILSLISVLSIGKVILRAQAISLVLPEEAGKIRRQALLHCILWPLAAYLFFYNALAAALSRRIVWRGIGYQLVSDSRLEIINQVRTDKK